MKRLFTLFLMTMMVGALYAQPPINCLFLVNALPFEEGDCKNNLVMEDILKGFGFTYTVQAWEAGKVPTDFDLVVMSEAIGSGDGVWVDWKTVPRPMLSTKVHSLKKSALGWVPTENTGTDYDNSADSIMKVVDASHEIMTGIDDTEIQICSGSGSFTSDANLGWVFIPDNPANYNVVAESGIEADDDGHQALVAIEPGADLNGNVIISKNVILAYHQCVWDDLTEEGIKVLENACYWAAGRKVPGGENAVSNNNMIETSVYPNPSVGYVNVRFGQVISDATVSVMSIDGKVVYTQQLTNTSIERFDLSELHSGVYFINFEGSDLSYTEKLIIY